MNYLFRLLLILTTSLCFAQNSIPKVLEKLNKKTVAYVSVNELKAMSSYVLLDAREPREYEVSHIKNALFVGFNKFNSNKLLTNVSNKEAIIVIYCSVGVRSEIIGEKLQKLGYKNVLNLYGGIFECKNSGEKVYDIKNVETEKVHTCDKEWSQYLQKGIKIYEK